MNVFLSVTHGTSEPAKFLEMCVLLSFVLSCFFCRPIHYFIYLHCQFVTAYYYIFSKSNILATNVVDIFSHYKGAADKSATPLAFVGKGITFDSGGISLKPGAVSLPLFTFISIAHI